MILGQCAPTAVLDADNGAVAGRREGDLMSILVDGKWLDAPKGSFVLIPGGFEEHMPGIAQWFRDRPTADSIPKPKKRAAMRP